MATSGSVDFSVDRDDIIETALKKLNVIATGASANANQLADGAIELNMIVKHLQTKGLQLWAKKIGYCFLALNTSKYSLGPSGDHATNSYTQTALAADAAASATSLTVDSISGISNGDNIGIVLDDGTLHWDTVNGAPSGSTVVITTGLASAASTDNAVFAYTTKINRPLRILDAVRRDTTDNTDVPLIVTSLSEYEENTNKTTDAPIVEIRYLPTLTDGELYVWPQGDDVNTVIRFWYHRPFEDFDAASDTPDFPQEWYLTLVYILAAVLCDTYSVTAQKASRITKRAKEYLMEVCDWDQEDASLFFEPDSLTHG